MVKNKLAVWSFWFSLIAFLLVVVIYFMMPPSFPPMESSISIIFTFLSWLPLLISVVTLVLGIVTLRKIKKKKQKGKGLAIATIILSAIVILWFIYLFYILYELAKINFD